MDTNRLIDALVSDLRPVRSLSPTWHRVAAWLGLALPPVTIIVAVMGLRSDLGEQLSGGWFLAEMLAMVATGLAGSYAALAAGIPGTRRRVILAPAVPLTAWLGLLTFQYGHEWREAGATFWPDVHCIPAIAIIGLVPIAVMIAMIRRGARDRRTAALFWGTLAASAMANAGLRLFHPVDSALMVIVWQFGTVMALSGLVTLARSLLVPISANTHAEAS